MDVVPGMIKLFRSKKSTIFRVIQIELDRTEIVAQSGPECLMELRSLVRDPIAATVSDENLSGGIEGEVHSVPGTGIAYLLDPFVAAGPKATICFTAQVNVFDLSGGKGRFNINRTNKGRKVHALVPGGNVPQDGPALVKGALVLASYIELYVFITIAPVGRKMIRHAERPFGEDVEFHVRAIADDAPHLFPPWISLLEKSVGGHIHPHPITRRDLEIPFPVPFHRFGEILGTGDIRRLSRNLVSFVQHEHITVGTAFTVLPASVPRVPRLEVDHSKDSLQIPSLPGKCSRASLQLFDTP